VAIGYAACTAVFGLWPEAAASFTNTLFHGLDFRKLQNGPALFNFGSFVYMRAVPGFFPELSTQLAKGDSP